MTRRDLAAARDDRRPGTPPDARPLRLDRIDRVLAASAVGGLLLAAGLGIGQLAFPRRVPVDADTTFVVVLASVVVTLSLAARLSARRTGAWRRAAVAIVLAVISACAMLPSLLDTVDFGWSRRDLVAVVAGAGAGALLNGLLVGAGAARRSSASSPAGRRVAGAVVVLGWAAALAISTAIVLAYRADRTQWNFMGPMPTVVRMAMYAPAVIGLSLAAWVISLVTLGTVTRIEQGRRLAASEAMTGARIILDCPECRAVIEGPPGVLRCPQCRERLVVEVEEPRCACGYVLYRLAEPRCPECGRAVEHAERFVAGTPRPA